METEESGARKRSLKGVPVDKALDTEILALGGYGGTISTGELGENISRTRKKVTSRTIEGTMFSRLQINTRETRNIKYAELSPQQRRRISVFHPEG